MKDLSQKLLGIFLAEHREHVGCIRDLLPAAAAPGSARVLEELLRRAHTLKGAARTVGMEPVETLAHRLEALFARSGEGGPALDEAARTAILAALDAIEDSVAALAQNRPAPETGAVLARLNALAATTPTPPPTLAAAAPAAGPMEAIQTAPVRAADLDRLLGSAGQLLAESQVQNRIGRELRRLARQLRDVERICGRLRAATETVLGPEMAVLGREIRDASVQAQALEREQQRSSWSLARLVQRVDQDIAHLRLVAADSVFGAFRKMVRDLAADEGRQVEFCATGLETEADRLVLQALKDAVMHLLRNAVGHGIEPPAERAARGKPAAGLIGLRVEARGGRLNVTVEDDGRGIDVQAVAEAAVRRGLISKEEAASRPAEDLARLVLQPGVSTAPAPTRLAGRGMGLSVVHELARRLHGEVSLRPRCGAGTEVLISVPLAVARHPVVLVECGGRVFAMPAESIERLCRFRPEELRTVEGREAVNLNGAAVPVARLADLLELPNGSGGAPARALPAVLLHCAGQRVALAVDALLEEKSAVVKELGLDPGQAGKTGGGAVLEDGRLALLLNPADLLESFRHAAPRPAPAPAPAAKKKQGHILVVDDSITTRSLEKSILEAHGYRVRVAVDGLEALEQLRAEKADLVIADILMPRLDGFGLLEAMKKDRELAGIPVIIVSSVEQQEQQQRGLALGADAYLVKQKFDQRELLETVRQIL